MDEKWFMVSCYEGFSAPEARAVWKVVEAVEAWREDLVHREPRDVELESTLVRAIDSLASLTK